MKIPAPRSALSWIFGGGLLLRILYALGTHYDVRAYDWDGHIEYVVYVLDHLRIPPVHGGWQFFQPPLYYFLSAAFAFSARMLGLGHVGVLHALRAEALFLSCIALGVGLWIAVMLFPRKEDRTERLLFFGFLSTFPGIVFFASRITNDALIVLLSFAFFGFLVRWYQNLHTKDWIIASVFVALGILTKSNALAWLAILFGALLFARLGFYRKIKLGLLGLSVVMACSGWIFGYRFLIEDQDHLVGNIGSNNPELRIDTIATKNFFVIRPHEMLRSPWNSPWEDTYGRRYFWEHLLKSSIVGEWNFGETVHDQIRLILVLLLLFSLFAAGCALTDVILSPRRLAPLWLTGIILPTSMMALVLKEPIGGFQDFRYIPLFIIPVAYYFLEWMTTLPHPLRFMARQACILFIILCTVYLLTLLQL